MPFDITGRRIWIAGHRGMVGSALVRRLTSEGCEILVANRDELDLLDQAAVRDWMAANKPDAVVVAAAKVGGILANSSFPVDFLYNNLMIEANIMEAAHRNAVDRLLFLGSSCIYPKQAAQPIVEDSLLTGRLEPTNEWYAIAKIAGIKLAAAYREQYGRDYISAMPTNLYGPGDNFDLQSSHVLPALLRKAHEAKKNGADAITIWGSGRPRREFLHVDDCADAVTFILKSYSDIEHINVGSGEDISIRDLTKIVCDVVGFEGSIECDTSKPDGTMRKLMSGEKLHRLGWRPKTELREGIETTYAWFLQNAAGQ